MRRAILVLARGVILAGATLWAGAAMATELRVAGPPLPDVQAAATGQTRITAAAIGAEGRQFAFATLDPGRDDQSVIVLHTGEGAEPVRVPLPGVVRALLFDPQGTTLFAIRFREVRKRQGDAELVSIELVEGKARTVLRLPPSAAALDYSAARESLLVAGDNEIRTVRLDGLRSGPLFRVPGPNDAIASLATSDAVLLAQADQLLLLDLSDPQGEESMPIRERTTAPASIVGLAADPEGTSALARLADGQVFRVRFGPLALEPEGSGDLVVASGKASTRDPVPLAPLPIVEPPQVAVDASGAPSLEPGEPAIRPSESTPEPGGSAGDETREAEAAAAAAVATAAPPEGAPPTLESDAPAQGAPAIVPAPPPPGAGPRVWGRLDGPEAGAVLEVVLFGPDSVLREALRVRPTAEGVWTADGLPPGRYQVQLSAGGDRVLVSDPRVALVEIGADGVVEAQSFRVIRAYAP